MEITVTDREDVAVLDVNGSIDASNNEELRDTLTTLLDQGTNKFVVNLNNVDFIDSSGLGVLVAFFKKVRIGEGDVKLAGMKTQIQKIFELTRLDRVFNVYEDVDAALKD